MERSRRPDQATNPIPSSPTKRPRRTPRSTLSFRLVGRWHVVAGIPRIHGKTEIWATLEKIDVETEGIYPQSIFTPPGGNLFLFSIDLYTNVPLIHQVIILDVLPLIFSVPTVSYHNFCFHLAIKSACL